MQYISQRSLVSKVTNVVDLSKRIFLKKKKKRKEKIIYTIHKRILLFRLDFYVI